MHNTDATDVATEAIAEAIAEAEASANDSAEARAWLAVLAEVIDLADD